MVERRGANLFVRCRENSEYVSLLWLAYFMVKSLNGQFFFHEEEEAERSAGKTSSILPLVYTFKAFHNIELGLALNGEIYPMFDMSVR